ncbi:hypothetical protein HYDPIDRAFT_24542 [Hydnomerulius pinastri MD-312]|nr:hypothetical protein HYDPIDRAFT_24542 [Hydnomerulius pinastri MD-312]
MSSSNAQNQPEAGPSTLRAPAQPSSRRESWDGEPTYGAKPSILPDDFEIPSCLDRTSVFFQVLTAPYQPPAEIPAWKRPKARSDDAVKCEAMVHWTEEEKKKTSEPSDVPLESSSSQPESPSDLNKPMYEPHGRWAWTRGFSIDDPKQLLLLRKGAQCSASIDSGSIDGKEVKYICRRWKTSTQSEWFGFYSELALYKSDQYLKPLQGDVVPHIIGVHVLPEAISVTMEMPNSSFWMESSPSMPDVLKEMVIAAFEKIHAQGVLHGDPELRHMLIGADGSVMIIDFGMSRANRAHESVSIDKAEPEEFRLEMRKVKYKLNYMGARKKEKEKVDEYLRRVRRNQKILDLWERRSRGERVGPIPPFEEDPGEYKLDPPVNAQDFQEDWITASDDRPIRIVVPGQTTDQVANEVQTFIRILVEMQSIPPVLYCDSARSARLKRKLSSESVSISTSSPTSGQSPSKRAHPPPSPWGSSSAQVHMWYSDDPEESEVSLPHARNSQRLSEAASRIKVENLVQFRRHRLPHPKLIDSSEIGPHRLKKKQLLKDVASLGGMLRRRENDKFSSSARYVESTAIRRDYLRHKNLKNAYIATLAGAPNLSGVQDLPQLSFGTETQSNLKDVPEGPRILQQEEYQLIQESRRQAIIRFPRAPRGILKRRRDDDPLAALGSPDLNDTTTAAASDDPSPRKKLRFSSRFAFSSNSRERAPSPELPIGRRPGDVVYSWHLRRPRVHARPESVDFTLPSLKTLSTLVGSLMPWTH